MTLSCNAKQPLEECIGNFSPISSFFRSPQQNGSTPLPFNSPKLNPETSSTICSSPNDSTQQQRSFFPSSPEQKKNGFNSPLMNEAEFLRLHSPKSPRRSTLVTLDESLPSRTNSPTLVMLTLTTPKSKNGHMRRKSFVFEVQSPHREEEDDARSENNSPINLKHVATIDEFSSNEKKTSIFSFDSSPINQIVVRNEDEPKFIYGVQFKVLTRFYIAAPGSDISIGNYVIVEGDRGLDLGIVISYYSKKEFRKIGGYRQKKFQFIQRLAYFSEYQQLMQKFYDEQSALSLIQSIVLVNFSDLGIKIVNCEFQFDRQKLVVYYKSNYKRIDFRSMVTAVWYYFRTRIWMERDETMDDFLMITNEAPILTSALTYSY